MAHIDKQRERLASLVNKIRMQALLNQTDFAELVGVKQSVISTWEQGSALPSGQNFFRLGSLARDSKDREWLWSQAGIDLAALDNFIDERIRGKISSAAEFIQVPSLDPKDKDTVPFPSRFLASPASARFIRARQSKDVKSFKIGWAEITEKVAFPEGSILIVEPSQAGLGEMNESDDVAVRIVDEKGNYALVAGRLRILNTGDIRQFWIDVVGGSDRQYIGAQTSDGQINLLGKNSSFLGRVAAWIRKGVEGK